jgi:mono/diheme cytochrome c family protein
MRMVTRIVLAFVVAALLVACSSPASTSTPEPTSTPVPPTAAPVSAADGEALFRTRCSSCHYLTDQPQVGPGLAGLFSRDQLRGQPFSEEVLAEQITKGGGGMPAFQLSADELTALIDYLRKATQ